MVGRGNDVIDLLPLAPLFQQNFPRYCRVQMVQVNVP